VKLEQWTAPKFFALTPGSSFGCRRESGSSREIGRVVVEETGRAGVYDYTVLAATGAEALAKWLNEHSYRVREGSEAVFKGYVDRGWCWLAVRLNVQRFDNGNGTIAPRPIRYTYRDKECVYPLIISQLSASDVTEVLVYVLSKHPYRCENWADRTIPQEQVILNHRSTSGTNYEELFESLTERRDAHVFVCESLWRLNRLPDQERRYFAGLLGEESNRSPDDVSNQFYLTRLRSIVRREAMDRDVVIVPREYPSSNGQGTVIDNEFRLRVSDERNDGLVTAVAFLAALLLGTSYLVRRSVVVKRML
jgi:hypothetical protein